ncbi:MAG: alpha-mannosidase [Promethearchaeota archaeon]
MPPLRRIILVSHTHWDREWYLPFEDFRWLLVKTLDQLIELMERNSEYLRFNLDGQTIVLEDYLELRPENRPRLKQLIEQNRIQIGPWYVLADEFLVSGESLIRNLLFGKQTGSEFGDVMAIGYVPDAFGHIAQLPQILRGFDIDKSIWWRGLEDHGKTLPTELRWRAPDGSEVLLVHLRSSYSTAANLPDSVDAALAQVLMPLNVLSLRGTSSAALLMNGSDHLPPQSHLPQLIHNLNERFHSGDILQGRTVTQLLETYGKSPIEKEITGMDELSPFINQLFADFITELKDVTVQHGTFKDYFDIIKNEVNLAEIPVIDGEQHASKYVPILPGVFSARMYLKQQNFSTQQLLERWVEPFSTIAWWLGAKYPSVPLRRAWQLLLQNHPHDSICGCSVDATHEDMERRFAWSQQLAHQLLSEAIHYINTHTNSNPSTKTPQSPIVTFRVFNPHPWDATDVIRVLLNLPTSSDKTSQLALYTARGEQIPFQMITAHKLDPILQSLLDVHTLPPIYDGEPQLPDKTRQIMITFCAEAIPSLGYATFYLASAPTASNGLQKSELRVQKKGEFYIIENPFIQLQISKKTGTLRLHHKPSKKTYHNVLMLEDTGDVGDEYNYCPPHQDQRITSHDNIQTRVLLHEKGPVTVTLEIQTQLKVPKMAHKTRTRRSLKTIPLSIQTLITVTSSSPRIDVQHTIQNTAKDHRLRVLFQTGINTNTAWGDTPFHVTERPLEPAPQEWGAQLYPMMMDYYLTSILKRPNIPGKPMGWFEDSATTHALQTFLDVNDDKQGLLIATRGLPEYEVLEDPNRTIALTLLRSIGWLSRDNLTTRRGHAGPPMATPSAQCLGQYHANYSIIPHLGTWKTPTTRQHTQQYITPLKAIQLHKTTDGHLAPSQSFLSVSPGTCTFSCLKKSEQTDSTILRFYETSGSSSKVQITSKFAIKQAVFVNLAEKQLEPIPMAKSNSNQIAVSFSPFQIRTLQLQLQSSSKVKKCV